MRMQEYMIEQLSKTRLFEMAYNREQYIRNVDSLADQIVENWCLIHYCTLYDPDNQNKSHWKQELQTYCKKLLRSIVEVNKQKATRYAMIEMLNLDDPKQIHAIVSDKFRTEKLTLDLQICEDFATIGLQKIIYLISDNFTITSYQELYRYIDEDI